MDFITQRKVAKNYIKGEQEQPLAESEYFEQNHIRKDKNINDFFLLPKLNSFQDVYSLNNSRDSLSPLVKFNSD